MAKKEFAFKGKSIEELKQLSVSEFAELIPSRQRRSLKRGMTDQQKILMKKIRADEKNIKTHCRNIIILPEMVEKTIKIHNGKEFVAIIIQPEMIGHYLGEFHLTRKRMTHSSPGIGATRSSSSMSVR